MAGEQSGSSCSKLKQRLRQLCNVKHERQKRFIGFNVLFLPGAETRARRIEIAFLFLSCKLKTQRWKARVFF